MTERVYITTKRSLDRHIDQTKSLEWFIPGAEPRYYLHKPGNRVYGTVIIFHGYGINAAFSTIQARYLFKLGFNTVAFNNPGAAQDPSQWPGTVLRESSGYDEARVKLLKTPFIAEFLESTIPAKTLPFLAKYGTTLIPKFKSILAGDTFRNARAAIDSLASERDKNELSGRIFDLFESEHSRYDAEPYTYLSMVSALPGPRYGLGYSLGGAQMSNLAGRSRALSAIVLLAPYFAKTQAQITRDYVALLGFLGTLNMWNNTVGTGEQVPARSLAAATIFAKSAARDEITQAVRTSTRTMCVIAEDDVLVEVEPMLEVCRSKLAAQKYFVYPKELGIDHFITPEVGNKYGISLMDQAARFFRDLQINDEDFLIAKNFTL